VLAKLAPPSWRVPGVPFTAQAYQPIATGGKVFSVPD